jgi:DNA-binding transcriptional LysR family regulator
MNIEDLRLFVDVARLGGFAAAARVRNLDPSAISRAIAAMEEAVCVRLFQRTTRRVSLTEAGEVFFTRIARLVDEFDATCDDARSISLGPAGTLRMTASNAFGSTCIAPLLPEFHAQHPNLRLELVLSDDNLDLVADRIDLAVRLGSTVDPSLTGAKLFDTHYRVCVSPTYLSRNPGLNVPADLARHRALLFPFGEFRSRWTFRSKGDETIEVVPVDGDIITTSALTLKSCAVAALGPTLLPNWLVDDDIAAGTLIDAFPNHRVSASSFETAVWIVCPSRSYLPGKVKAMTEFLRSRLRHLGGTAQ